MKLRKELSVLLALGLLSAPALAESITLNGTVTSSSTHEIYSPVSGTVGVVFTQAGGSVKAGDSLAQVATQKVYASCDGTVTGVFGQSGDDAQTVSERYGAVMYLEGTSLYTVSASTKEAYSAVENRIIHVGEKVELKCTDGKHTGSGTVTAVSGIEYTVRVDEGEFLIGETVAVFRSSSSSAVNRIGRGTLNRTNPIAVTANGSIVSIAVKDGDTVKRGDLLMETVSNAFDGLYMSGTDIVSDESGIVYEMKVNRGNPVEKDQVALVLYPENAMQITAEVSEYDLGNISVGMPVRIELLWNQDSEVSYRGTVRMISAIANTKTDPEQDTTFNVYIDFTPDSDTRYGMNAVVTVPDPAEEE